MNDQISDDPISTLVGKVTRVYKTGDTLTEDFRPERVNVELSEDNKIVQIWMG